MARNKELTSETRQCILEFLCLEVFFATLPRRPASQSCRFTFDVETGVLVLLLSCALGPPTPLSILVRASLRCSVKGGDRPFLGHFSHGIALIYQNRNKLMGFRRKSFLSL